MPSKTLKTKPKPNPNAAAVTSLAWEFEAIGTRWHISLSGRARWPAGLRARIRRLIDDFDGHYSRFRADSMVSRMAQTAGRYHLPADAQALFDLYRQLYDISDGRVTPLVGQALADAGYDANYRLTPQPMQPAPAWDQVLDYDFPFLTLRQPALLDLGAAGKGYLVDLVCAVLRQQGIDGFCVDAGGDMYYQTPLGPAEPAGSASPALRVGLEHPLALDEVIGIAELRNQSLCGSAGNRRVWADGAINHILDPVELASPRHLLAVWVCADSALLADGLTTALYFCRPELLLQHFSFSYAMVDAVGRLQASPDFPASFFTANPTTVHNT